MTFPRADLPSYFPSDMELRLQVWPTFVGLHTAAERGNYFYGIAHRAIQLGAKGLENPPLENAVSIGATAFEIVGSLVDPSATYGGVDDNMKVLYGANRFLEGIKTVDDFLLRVETAKQRMREDAPSLHDAIEEIVSPHVQRDKVAIWFALGGAGIIRSMQIYVDNRLTVADPEVSEQL